MAASTNNRRFMSFAFSSKISSENVPDSDCTAALADLGVTHEIRSAMASA